MKKVATQDSPNVRESEFDQELRDRTMTFPTADAMLRAAVTLTREVPRDAPAAHLASAYLKRYSQLFPDRAFALTWQPRGDEPVLQLAGPGCSLRSNTSGLVVPDSLLQADGLAEYCQVEPPFSVGPYTPVCSGAIAGFAIPLIDGAHVRGLLFTEYCFPGAVNGLDEELLPTLALHLQTALRQQEEHVAHTRALEGQLIQSEKLANLGLMAAGIVHELNNPLTSVCVYAELLRSKLDQEGIDESDRDKLDRIVDGATRVLDFARDLVSYARPSQSGGAPIAVVSGLSQAVTFCEHVIRERGVRVIREIENPLPPVRADRRELVQVWINLITNACQAMPMEGGELRLRVRREDASVLVQVVDNGAGMTEDVRRNLFAPFFSTKPDREGTGLGLSITKRIVERHGGQVWAESQPGQGSTLSVLLPSALSSVP